MIDLLAGILNIVKAEKQEILKILDIGKRSDRLTGILVHQSELLELGDKIQSQVRASIGKSQREVYLREQLKAIQEELGEEDQRKLETAEFRE